ncbi:MAG: glycosyltransferase family 2 protein [Planctomycetota bacterium]|nr:glycosyltransferase family 2 protein [Planctomycetota bacterium]
MNSVSVVVPTYNERENIPLLYDRVKEALRKLECDHEIVFVDDGSRDGSFEELRKLAAMDRQVKVVHFRRNYGQTAALQAGLQMASGDVIVTMDADLQNDPADIGTMLAKIDEGYDLVHGWRKKRQDSLLNRRLPSMIANWLISKATRFPIHDLGCTLKAIRREIAQDLELYGEMHRFIPILAHARGARCVEVETNHHPRQFGQTKYGISRTLRVILDLLTVKFLLDYFASPMKLFGMVGLCCALLSVLSGIATVVMKWPGGIDMTGNPLLLLTVFSLLVCIQFLSLGLLGELGARIYFGRDKQHYTVRELINFDHDLVGVDHPPQARAA